MTEPFGVSHWNEITMFKQRPDGVQVIRWKNLVFRIGPKNLPKHRSREPAVYLRRNKLSQQTTNRSKQKQGTSGFLPVDFFFFKSFFNRFFNHVVREPSL